MISQSELSMASGDMYSADPNLYVYSCCPANPISFNWVISSFAPHAILSGLMSPCAFFYECKYYRTVKIVLIISPTFCSL